MGRDSVLPQAKRHLLQHMDLLLASPPLVWRLASPCRAGAGAGSLSPRRDAPPRRGGPVGSAARPRRSSSGRRCSRCRHGARLRAAARSAGKHLRAFQRSRPIVPSSYCRALVAEQLTKKFRHFSKTKNKARGITKKAQRSKPLHTKWRGTNREGSPQLLTARPGRRCKGGRLGASRPSSQRSWPL